MGLGRVASCVDARAPRAQCAAWPRGGARPLFWRVAIPTPRVGLLGAGGQSAQLSQLLPFLILCFLKVFFFHMVTAAGSLALKNYDASLEAPPAPALA